jgi:small subunit ribosomal protein S1
LDESWWDSILAEEGGRGDKPSWRTAAKLSPNEKVAAGGRPASEPAQVDWDWAIELYEMDKIIALQVSGYNRGGLLVAGEGLQGFVPISHLVDMPVDKDEAEQEDCLKAYMGKSLQLKVIECDPSRGRVVFSERAAQALPGSRNLLLHELRPGQCVEGTVTNITEFGVFVDLGGVEGLIHVSEISWGRVRHPADVVHYGDEIRVHVINVDAERSRVGLSMKRLNPNPWETAEERYYPGQITEAVITSLVPFGAFARLEEGLDGLIHVSEVYPGDPSARLDELLYEGQHVKVRVLHVDAAKQRLGLSMILEE